MKRQEKPPRQSITDLADYLSREEEALRQQDHHDPIRKQRVELNTKNQKIKMRLGDLNGRFNEIGTRLGSQKAGYEFEEWFFDLIEYFEIPARRPYKHDGRQIDGSATVGDTTYLVELKFTTSSCDSPDVDTFLRKVTTKADNTMGVLISMSGFTSTAVREASGPKTPLLLMDHSHVMLLLREEMSFRELLKRLRRHSSQTGVAFLAVRDFG